MRVAIVKPEIGVSGGFEHVLRRIRAELERGGHEVETIRVDASEASRTPYAVDVPLRLRRHCFELVRCVGLAERFAALDLRRFDLVLSTQPPSFSVTHPRHVALFYHHLRVYYDLSEVFVAAGFVDPHLHAAAERAVRRFDDEQFADVAYFLAGSEDVRRRLAEFNMIDDRVGLFLAGVDATDCVASDVFESALCVSRHEFSKRAELFVHAMKYVPKLRGSIAGGGGRSAWAAAVDARLSSGDVDLDAVDARELWLNTGVLATAVKPAPWSNVDILGYVTDVRRDELYRRALCVVAPALREDYGLTALEAMAYGKPVIVCEDGGGLKELVQDGRTGFVVKPEGRAIAAAISRLREDPALARELGRNGREVALAFTWDRAMGQLKDGLERVAA